MDNIIPIIDLQKILDISPNADSNKDWVSAAQEIRYGFSNIGFIYLVNHGIKKSVIKRAFSELSKFFDLPKEIKQKYKKAPIGGNVNANFGYTQASDELLNDSSPNELRETFDFLEGFGVYPDSELPDFNISFQALRNECKILTKKILILWAISLQLDDNAFFLKHTTHIDDLSLPRGENMRALHYPPIPNHLQTSTGTIRLGEHCDVSMLTLLFQDMVGGLEVQIMNGKWVAATPIPDAILVNTGELLEIWTGGIFPATKHRVVVPENEKQNTPRYSIAYFIGPNVDTVISPLKIKKTESEEKRIAAGNYDAMKPVTAKKYILDRLLNYYANK